MSRYLWPLIVALVCLPVVLLATGFQIPGWAEHIDVPRLMTLPEGDQELAWIHTTTNAATWERFVSGMMRASMTVPGLTVDDTNAFQDSTTAVPEIVLRMAGRSGQLRIRWYKIRNDVTAVDWVRILATRSPPPLAIIGGGSTDRAVDLARALDSETGWKGDRPLLLITTATADRVASADDAPGALPGRALVDIYDDRTFRFCFTNRQMADAVLDFVWNQPDLRPKSCTALAWFAIASPLSASPPGSEQSGLTLKPRILSVHWDDDPYSTDLQRQFTEGLIALTGGDPAAMECHQWSIPYSVGGLITANAPEKRTAESLARVLRESGDRSCNFGLQTSGTRSILLLPAVAHPARRFLRALANALPQGGLSTLNQSRSSEGHPLVVVSGDGIPVNTIYRDGEFAWPVAVVATFPTVFFTHNNPTGWDVSGGPTPPSGYDLRPPNSTEDVLHFQDLGEVIARACFPETHEQFDLAVAGGLIVRSDQFLARLRNRTPRLFDLNGDRLGGKGEYVVVISTTKTDGESLPTMSVWRRESGDATEKKSQSPTGRWQLVRRVRLDAGKSGECQ